VTERIGPLSNTLEASLRAEALEEALECWGVPEILDKDPGGQFRSLELASVPEQAGVKTSMDGKGLWLDNWVHLESGPLCSRSDISRVTTGQLPLCSLPTNRTETTP